MRKIAVVVLAILLAGCGASEEDKRRGFDRLAAAAFDAGVKKVYATDRAGAVEYDRALDRLDEVEAELIEMGLDRFQISEIRRLEFMFGESIARNPLGRDRS